MMKSNTDPADTMTDAGSAHGMKRNDHYSDRYVRRMYECDALTLLKAKVGRLALDDTRFCDLCETWYAADLFASLVEFEGREQLLCARCADRFRRMDDCQRRLTLDACEINYRYYSRQLRDAGAWRKRPEPMCGNHRLGTQTETCANCHVAVAHYRP